MKINCNILQFHQTGQLDVLKMDNVTLEDPVNNEVLFKVGDKVTSIPFNTAKYGVQREYAKVSQDYLSKAPENLTTEEACSIWMQYSTAYFALFHVGTVRKDDFVFIPAISSSAGYGCFELA